MILIVCHIMFAKFLCTYLHEHKQLAPNCNTDENCSQYNWCYIAWWKLRDTIGPALLLRPEQNDDFFDIPNEDISEDVTNDPFWQPFFLSPFGDIDKVIEDGTEEVVGEDGTTVM